LKSGLEIFTKFTKFIKKQTSHFTSHLKESVRQWTSDVKNTAKQAGGNGYRKNLGEWAQPPSPKANFLSTSVCQLLCFSHRHKRAWTQLISTFINSVTWLVKIETYKQSCRRADPLDNLVTLTFDLLTSAPMHIIMSTKFGVNSSSCFPSRARTQTDTQSHRRHWSACPRIGYVARWRAG